MLQHPISKQRLALRAAIATVLIGMFSSASAAPTKRLVQKGFDYDEGLTVYANTKVGRNTIPKQLIGFYCGVAPQVIGAEHQCDVWTQGKNRTHRYVVTVPNGLNGQVHRPLATKSWELVRSPLGRGKYHYAFNSNGAPKKIARKDAEADFALFIQGVMKDVSVMQGNEDRFIEQVRKQRAAEQQRLHSKPPSKRRMTD